MRWTGNMSSATGKRLAWLRSAAFLAASVAVLALSGFLAPSSTGSQLAKVVSVDDSDLRTLGHVKYGTQALEVEILEGPLSGKTFRAGNAVRGQMELDKVFKPGERILVSPPSGDEQQVLSAQDHWRVGPILISFAVFAVLLVAFGGPVGMNALSSFIFCCAAIWKIVVPLALAGWSAPWVAFAATGAMTAVIMLLVGGFSGKALGAFGGAIAGVAAGLGLAHLFGAAMDINGATLPFVQTLVYSGYPSLDLADIFIAAAVIAGSGAMMDLSMDIAAGLDEVSRHNPSLGFVELLRSGLRIGRATVGTMTTTLLLAYSGGYLSLLRVFSAEGRSPVDFANSPIVAAEIAKTLVGSFAIVLVAPFTALLSAMVFSRRRLNGKRQG